MTLLSTRALLFLRINFEENIKQSFGMIVNLMMELFKVQFVERASVHTKSQQSNTLFLDFSKYFCLLQDHVLQKLCKLSLKSLEAMSYINNNIDTPNIPASAKAVMLPRLYLATRYKAVDRPVIPPSKPMK